MDLDRQLMDAAQAIVQISLTRKREGEQKARERYARAIQHLNEFVATVHITKELTNDIDHSPRG